MKILKETNKKESGQALILVLILLLVGGLIIAPLMGFMGTGLIASQVFEEKMDEVFAADAGIENALHKIVNNDASLPATAGDTWPLDTIVVNGKDVTVVIELEETAEGFIGEGLLDEKYSGVHDDWQVVDDVVGDGTYTITIIYDGAAGTEYIDGVGAWLQGDYDYVADSAIGMTDDFPNLDSFEVRPYKGGTAFIWVWKGATNMPRFGSQSGVYTRSLTFEFTPAETPAFYISWGVSNQAAIGVITSGETFGIWKVTATATDSSTGKQTEVIAYVSREGEGIDNDPYVVRVLIWEINPPE